MALTCKTNKTHKKLWINLLEQKGYYYTRQQNPWVENKIPMVYAIGATKK